MIFLRLFRGPSVNIFTAAAANGRDLELAMRIRPSLPVTIVLYCRPVSTRLRHLHAVHYQHNTYG